MPRLLPDLTDADLRLVKSEAERRFYEACRDQLPSTWTVLFSTALIGTTPTGRRHDGEADFVLLVPHLGLLVIEVKGGGIIYNPSTGRWHSVDRHGLQHDIKDPFRQATAEKHQLIQVLRADGRWNRAHPGRLLAGHAVMFADLDQPDTALGPGSPPEIIGGRSQLQTVQSWATAVLNFWAGRDSTWLPLEPSGIETAEQILHGRVEVRPLLSAVIGAEEQIRVQLTLQQSRVLRGLGSRRRAAICGGAGTGKTLLAIEKARQVAESGGDTLLLCYNRLLADFLKQACHGIDRLTVLSYHQLCSWRSSEAKALTGRNLLQEARQQTPASNPSAEYDLVLPLALALSCEATPLRFDAIVIDEGQDFKDEYWLGIEWLLRDQKESCLYVFFDQNQALYTRSASMPITDPAFVLTFNCRNTRHIHESAYRFFQGEPTDYPPGNEGAPILSLTSPTLAEQARTLHTAVVDLIAKQGLEPSQIGVLICGEPKEMFFRVLRAKPVPKGANWLVEGSVTDRGIRLETVKRFKGLEADVVFLWGIDSMPLGEQREVLYVGISRAKSRLTLVGTEEVCRRALEAGDGITSRPS